MVEHPVAAVYRGPISSEGCPESLAKLLRHAPAGFKVHYLGPDEDEDVTAESLSKVDLFAWPGGGDEVKRDYKKVARYTKAIQDFIRDGGLYAGICLGAFLAKGEPSEGAFFNLLPSGSYVNCERFEKGSQVKSDKDSVIQTDWHFHSGPKKGTREKRWQYFQDGANIVLGADLKSEAMILGRYSKTGDPCAVVYRLGSGAVGLIGVHPEAEKDWYEDWDGHNPDGIQFDIGHDFVQTLWNLRSR
ncbi:hypothetical protein BD324DRAFT_625643 [Kockovaella imperatae]|uniref:Biotin-protein ligase N-terminal domain-containing protein n=1 Tax=Kockovaella imperatae TaxID=4999 RepID=A0A1Y1UJK5_9TREE|nr:hypothetical protein BD324DRAFT_625643 [Kockovaella imperatae]ORX37305.1 hypothetical protein BD324DRAFT_625643 [Kockovaella imperatae]